jgi:aspartate aminotransferase
VLSDEIYSDFIYTGEKHVSLATIAEGMKHRTAIISGFSKSYALQGWRLGYVAAPKAWTQAMASIQSHLSHHPSTLSQAAGLACLREGNSFLKDAVQSYQQARDFLVSALKDLPGWPREAPQGAFYVWMDIRPYLSQSGGPLDSLGLAETLLEKHQVIVIPGSGFGKEGWMRLSFANSLSSLEIAASRLKSGLLSLLS